MGSIRIDVISDVVCPWCYIGRRHLQTALDARPELDASVNWRPFLLHPFLGPEGMDKDELMTMKFGRSSGRMFDRVRDAGRNAGIAFAFEAIRRVPDTVPAHCLLEWAKRDGVQDPVAIALFAAYFERGEDVSEHEVLARIAREHGMDEAAVRRQLADGEDAERVRQEAEAARAETITGVPFFVVDGTYPIPGAQPPETIGMILDRVSGASVRESAAAPL